MSDRETRKGLRVHLALFVAGLFVSALFMFFFEGLGGDAVGRTQLAAAWLRQPYLITGTQIWPDGNYLLPAAVMYLGGDAFWGVRSVYAVIGAASIPLLYEVGCRLFGDRAALWAGIVWLVCGYRIAYSLEGATGEIPLVTCVLAALAVLLMEPSFPRLRAVVASGLLCAVGSMFRLEASYWALVLGALLLFWDGTRVTSGELWTRLSRVILLGALAASYPLFLVYRWWVVTGDAFYYFSYAKLNQGQFYTSGANPNWSNVVYYPASFAFWTVGVLLVLTPVVGLLAGAGLMRNLKTPRIQVVAAGCILLTLLFSIMSVRSRFPLEFRYALPVCALVCLFVDSGIEWISRHIRLPVALLAILVIASVPISYLAYSLASVVNRGVLGRRLGMLTPIRANQYSTRALVEWYEADGGGKRLLLSPCLSTPYLQLARPDLTESGKFVQLSTYQDEALVHTRATYTAMLLDSLRTHDLVAFNRDCAGLSFTDGRTEEIMLPSEGAVEGSAGELRLTLAAGVRNIAVYEIHH